MCTRTFFTVVRDVHTSVTLLQFGMCTRAFLYCSSGCAHELYCSVVRDVHTIVILLKFSMCTWAILYCSFGMCTRLLFYWSSVCAHECYCTAVRDVHMSVIVLQFGMCTRTFFTRVREGHTNLNVWEFKSIPLFPNVDILYYLYSRKVRFWNLR